MPREPKNTADGSGTAEAVKLPDCDVVTFRPEAKSAGVQVRLGQKYSWILFGVGAAPFGRRSVKVCEKPPMYVDPPARPATPVSLALPTIPTLALVWPFTYDRIMGEPANTEHGEEALLLVVEQSMFDEPGPGGQTMLNTRLGCAAKVRN